MTQGKCSECGAEVKAADQFCPKCGARFSQGTGPASPYNTTVFGIAVSRSAKWALAGFSLLVALIIIGAAFGSDKKASTTSEANNESGSEIVSYRAAASVLSKRVVQSMTDLTNLLTAPRLNDPTWRTEVTATINTLAKARLDWQNLNPPDDYKAANDQSLAALDAMMSACSNLQTGLATGSQASFAQGTNDFTRATALLKAAIALMPK